MSVCMVEHTGEGQHLHHLLTPHHHDHHHHHPPPPPPRHHHRPYPLRRHQVRRQRQRTGHVRKKGCPGLTDPLAKVFVSTYSYFYEFMLKYKHY